MGGLYSELLEALVPKLRPKASYLFRAPGLTLGGVPSVAFGCWQLPWCLGMADIFQSLAVRLRRCQFGDLTL